jgi:hypothetical protein
MQEEFCAFLRCFSGNLEKDQVSIGSGWWQWTQHEFCVSVPFFRKS